MVGASGFEPEASCAQGSCKKSISLVRLALFYVMVLGFRPNLSAFGPTWTQVFFSQLSRRQAGAASQGAQFRALTMTTCRLGHRIAVMADPGRC